MIPQFRRSSEMDENMMRPESEGQDARIAALAKMRESYGGEPAARPAPTPQGNISLEALRRRRQGMSGPGDLAALLQSMQGQGAGSRAMPAPGGGYGTR